MKTLLRPLPLGTAAVRFVLITLAALALCVSAGRAQAGLASAPIASDPPLAPVVATHAWLGAAPPIDVILFAPLLAQASPNAPVSKFLDFLALIFLIVGAITITYGGFQIAGGRIQEGLVAIFGGFIIAIAIPLMKYFLASAGVPI